MPEDTTPLTQEEIEAKLKDFPGWTYADNKISKQFEFASFTEATDFIMSIRDKFNEMDHHPDIHIFYKKIRFDLQRFDVGGKVTARDFAAANVIETAFKALKK